MSLRRLLSSARTILSGTPPGPTPQDFDALRDTLGKQREEIANLTAELLRLHAAAREAEERHRLALDRSRQLTVSEDRAVRFVSENPGAPVREVGATMAAAAKSWMHESRREVTGYDIDGEVKFIYLAFKKGHLRREPDGTTFRYWPIATDVALAAK